MKLAFLSGTDYSREMTIKGIELKIIKKESSMNTITHDPDNRHYLITLEGDAVATVYYEKKGNTLDVISTRIPDELQGKGYGKVMMEAFLSEMKSSDLLIVPVCSYVVHYMNKNPQWHSLLAK